MQFPPGIASLNLVGLRAAAAVVSLFVVVARVRAGIVIAARVAVVCL